MEMTNEEKARELAFESPQCQMYIDNGCNQNFACDRFKVALKMAKWKDEQHAKEKQRWIERVLTILTNWAKKHTKECDGDKFMRMGLTNDLVIYFKQAMKGE